jgi:hypothetical protein
MSDLTEYEKERLARIAENKKLLQSLQIDRDSRASRDGTPDEAKAKAKRKATTTTRRVKTDFSEPLRVSTRSRTQRTASLMATDPEAAKRKQEEEEEQEKQAILLAKRVKHEYVCSFVETLRRTAFANTGSNYSCRDREIEVWNPSGRYVIEEAALPLRQTLHSIAGEGSWKRALKQAAATTPAVKKEANGSSPPTPVVTSRRASARKSVKKEESDSEVEEPVVTSRRASARNSATPRKVVKKEESDSEDEAPSTRIGMTSLRKTFDTMSMRAVKKITPDRVYSLAVHPTTDKDLVFVGDRKGWLGIWNASADAQDDIEEEEDEENELDRNAFAQRVYNDHGTISCLRFDPLKAHT